MRLFDAKLRFALFVSLRLNHLLAKFKWTTNCQLLIGYFPSSFQEQAPITKLRRLRKDKIDRFTAEVPEETFSSVGGLSDAKETILRQMMHLHEPRIYSTLGVSPPSGILVHGAPGAGKTLLCKSSAGEIGVKMICVSTPELVSGVSGGSEKNIRQLFENAKENTPCIIFLDELDAICSSRDENTKEMSNRIIAQILTCMDDVDSNEILVLGATSKVENIDSSLRRAGRFDQEITIGIPSEKERLAVMQVVCKDLKLAGLSLFSRYCRRVLLNFVILSA